MPFNTHASYIFRCRHDTPFKLPHPCSGSVHMFVCFFFLRLTLSTFNLPCFRTRHSTPMLLLSFQFSFGYIQTAEDLCHATDRLNGNPLPLTTFGCIFPKVYSHFNFVIHLLRAAENFWYELKNVVAIKMKGYVRKCQVIWKWHQPKSSRQTIWICWQYVYGSYGQ